jgi:hypothetical protein
MLYYKAWYRSERDGAPADDRYPDWVVYAVDADDARARVLTTIQRLAPERGYEIYLRPINDDDQGTIAFASARQSGQAIY